MNFNQIISNLKQRRSVFHSEDDLKLEMAITIRELYPDFNVRLERPININMHLVSGETLVARAPIDIIILDTKAKLAYPIEIKYKTKRAIIFDASESFVLANHGANDVGRYSFRKDIFRIENVAIDNYSVQKGFVFILTNDKGYYENDVSSKNSLDSFFSFHHGAMIKANYSGWNYEKLDKNKYILEENPLNEASLKRHWTLGKEYVYNLSLNRDYSVQWHDYSFKKAENGKAVDFKYCLIEVDPVNNFTGNKSS